MVPQFMPLSEPRNMAEARFSMPHSLAVASWTTGSPCAAYLMRVKDKDVRRLSGRVKMIVARGLAYGALAGPTPHCDPEGRHATQQRL